MVGFPGQRLLSDLSSLWYLTPFEYPTLHYFSVHGMSIVQAHHLPVCGTGNLHSPVEEIDRQRGHPPAPLPYLQMHVHIPFDALHRGHCQQGITLGDACFQTAVLN